MQESMETYLELANAFELKKRSVPEGSDMTVILKLPPVVLELIDEHASSFEEAVRKCGLKNSEVSKTRLVALINIFCLVCAY